MHLTIQTRYYHPMLRKDIYDFSCDACQKMKLPGPGYGLLPERYIGIIPWDENAVDLIGLWTVKIRVKTTGEVFALTIIDTASNLVSWYRLIEKLQKTLQGGFITLG